jgi:co-chaperonin GroES (HSP10)
MKMLQGNVLVTEVEKETTTAGGIILTDPGKLDKATQPGLVLAISPEVEELGTVKPGDQLITKKAPHGRSKSLATIVKP